MATETVSVCADLIIRGATARYPSTRSSTEGRAVAPGVLAGVLVPSTVGAEDGSRSHAEADARIESSSARTVRFLTGSLLFWVIYQENELGPQKVPCSLCSHRQMGNTVPEPRTGIISWFVGTA